MSQKVVLRIIAPEYYQDQRWGGRMIWAVGVTRTGWGKGDRKISHGSALELQVRRKNV